MLVLLVTGPHQDQYVLLLVLVLVYAVFFSRVVVPIASVSVQVYYCRFSVLGRV